MNAVIIDVRERDEFEAEHIEHSVHIPLSNFGIQAPSILKSLQGRPVILMCRSGKRATLAASQAAGFANGQPIEVFPGGILEWKKQGKPTVAAKKAHFPIMRQVQLVAGTLVLSSVALAHLLSPAFIWIAGLVGTGLTIAGATGFCGMAELLSRLPWNKTNPSIQQELCNVSPLSGTCSMDVHKSE